MSHKPSSLDVHPANAPQHGFRGEQAMAADHPRLPEALTVAVSRESGSRGIVIAKRVAKQLDWSFYDQETLEYTAQEGHLSQQVFSQLDEQQIQWVEERFNHLLEHKSISDNPSIQQLTRVILAIGVRGEAVILGRGAGCVLPSASTLYVRVVAPLPDRIAFLSQLERLTPEQAAEQVCIRDQRRSQFVQTHFRRATMDLYQFDLILNSSQLGEEISSALVKEAAIRKQAAWYEMSHPKDELEPDLL